MSLARLQRELDDLSENDETCRDAWCGFWIRGYGGIFEKHKKHPRDEAPQ